MAFYPSSCATPIRLLLSILVVVFTQGCTTPEPRHADRQKEKIPVEVVQAWGSNAAFAGFYWPYAAMAANVYRSQGQTHSEIAPVVGSPWLRTNVADSASGSKPAIPSIADAEGLYRERVVELCRRERRQGAPAQNCEQTLRLCRRSAEEAKWTHSKGLATLSCKETIEMCSERKPEKACRVAVAAKLVKKDDLPQQNLAVPDEHKQLGSEPDESSSEEEKPLFVQQDPAKDEDCLYRSGDGDPHVPVNRLEEDEKWTPVPELYKQTHPSAWRLFVPELAIDVWRREHPREGTAPVVEYAIVFRGTTGGGGMLSNMRGLFFFVEPFLWDQYRQARRATNAILDQIDRLHKISDALHQRDVDSSTRVRITTVGHSLGGGLASYLYLRDPRITRAVVFNASPIDGASTVPIGRREQVMLKGNRFVDSAVSGPKAAIYSLFERGEILSSAFPCQTGPLWGEGGGPQVQCDRADLSKGSIVDQHNMAQLACKLFLVRKS